MVAVTGSNGKTTVKEMTASVLQTWFSTHKTSGNLNNHIGVPLAVLGLDVFNRVMVLEMGMNHLGEISRLCEIARPDVGVITNIGLAHLGCLGSVEAIQQAKGELTASLDASGVGDCQCRRPEDLGPGPAIGWPPDNLRTNAARRRERMGARKPGSCRHAVSCDPERHNA